MAKRERSSTAKKIEKWIEEGRGKGEGSEYKPWLTIRDVPSKGIVTRTKGWKSNRIHHLLSHEELDYLYILEWSDSVVDIREQYPLLPQERTLEIADSLGIKHPYDPKSKDPIVMTTDFLVTRDTEKGKEIQARTIKPSSELKGRVLEKFAIEQQFYHEQGIDWGIVTDEDKPSAFLKNMDWLYDSKRLDKDSILDNNLIYKISETLLKEIVNRRDGLSTICLDSDEMLGFTQGTCLFVVKYMIANKKWYVNMNKKIETLSDVDIYPNN
ncbi:heteromeric transposase endonuclease subunit TnsA [Salipaludibacillus neizhouensis]|uniref:Heteromeric transposase endonuclease subunit TnsA n=1 Tax=Salipaludibacillus neizhouensis TaxID=885475 RepID=A0A3A9JZE9_9BACI|nr:TnsA endonuclease N-terminal domain-containing protein [Salipaludibacillus neizhouensis]RKL65857.1 heteromeric transposase endonuclease subunit TnsA [Salipaludibacillus neizhouensis]